MTHAQSAQEPEYNKTISEVLSLGQLIGHNDLETKSVWLNEAEQAQRWWIGVL